MAAQGTGLRRMRGKEQNLPLALQAGPGASEPGRGWRSSQPLALQRETGNLLSPPSSEGDVASLGPRRAPGTPMGNAEPRGLQPFACHRWGETSQGNLSRRRLLQLLGH